jgi:hypothetical protein
MTVVIMNNLARVLSIRQFYPATITTWNRLEGRTRGEDFDRALKAEVRDALWMISRQWQFGEFIGDDAGSPVLAKAHMATSMLTKYQPGAGQTMAFDNQLPFEVKVEHQPISFKQGQQEIALDLRLMMGRQWLKWVGQVDANLKSEFIEDYGIEAPDPDDPGDAFTCAHIQVWQQYAAAAGRCMDGYKLYEYLKLAATNKAADKIDAPIPAADEDAINDLGDKFVAWFEKLFYQPLEQDNPSWKPAYLEHQFACSAPQGDGEKVLTADEYYHGHLDWYNLDIAQDQAELAEPPGPPPAEPVEGSLTHTFIPTSVAFGGMPNLRWWTFEDRETDLSFVKPDTPDLNKLLLLDFVLVYANDWFLVPFTLQVGSLAEIKGLMVTNVFGETTWVRPANAGPDQAWDRWSMYNLSVRGDQDVPADLILVVLPAARKVLESPPLEEVYLLRDEIANMVWAVEAQVPLASGKSKPGREAGYELKAWLQQLLDATHPAAIPVTYQANIRYQIVNSVPEQWIPFLPVHIDNNLRQIQLQRAAMPRILKNDDNVPKKVEPRTSLMREGLDQAPQQTYFIHEEEVPRAGIRIYKTYQRTRWYDGKVYNWLGIRKQVGRGGGSSGLAFDQIIPVEATE